MTTFLATALLPLGSVTLDTLRPEPYASTVIVSNVHGPAECRTSPPREGNSLAAGGRYGGPLNFRRPPNRPDAVQRPHPDRFPADRPEYAAAMAAHESAVQRGEAGYLDPTSGLFVMTAQYLLERGFCCDQGCRHCPYVGADPGT